MANFVAAAWRIGFKRRVVQPARRVLFRAAVPIGRDAAVLVDIDLSILGSDMARFDEYEVQVREEYSWVPGPLFRSGRRKILQEFANRESIFTTEYFRDLYEAQARSNIARSLARR